MLPEVRGEIYADTSRFSVASLTFRYNPVEGFVWGRFYADLLGEVLMHYAPTAAEYEFALADAKARYDETFKR